MVAFQVSLVALTAVEVSGRLFTLLEKSGVVLHTTSAMLTVPPGMVVTVTTTPTPVGTGPPAVDEPLAVVVSSGTEVWSSARAAVVEAMLEKGAAVQAPWKQPLV